MRNVQAKSKIFLGNNRDVASFYDINEGLLGNIENRFCVKIVSRGNKLQVIGNKDNVASAVKLLKKIVQAIKRGDNLSFLDIENIESSDISSITDKKDILLLTTRGKEIRPKTEGQKEYVEAMNNFDIVFAIGPAGTGKTYLAVAMAVLFLKTQKVSRIILTRPAIEAGEKLGFLPGDIQAKVDPYFRPIYDALFDMMENDKFQNYLERGIIEIAPLAFMRGRTLNDAFIILDEAQNTTPDQMKMFLTRPGFSSRVVITGDITQIDLPSNVGSGLLEAKDILSEIDGIKFIYFNERDIVRHELVQKIIKAYEKYESSNGIKSKNGQKYKESN